MRLSTLTMVCLTAACWIGPSVPVWCEQPGVQQGKQEEFTIKVELQYQLFLPEDYGKDEDKLWPMILFLHGKGESGNDLNKVKVHGPPKIVETQKGFPFIVVSPQSRDYGWDPEVMMVLLDRVAGQYRVDRDRVYLTGLSMGGYGTWSLAARHPERFAAIVPICGGGNPNNAERLKDLPIWVFHGAQDLSVPIGRSVIMVNALKAAGGNVKFTVYPDAGHDCWTETYDNPKLYEWLLQQKRLHK